MKSATRAREGGRLPFELRERFGETVRDADVAAAELPHQLHVVVAGDAEAVPSATMPITSRRTSGVFGPRSTRSPRKTALRPAGWRARQPTVAAAPVGAGSTT